MPVKAVLTKAEFDKLAAPEQFAYVERDGRYVVDLEGDPPGYVAAAKLDEFREHNRRLNGEVSDLQVRLKAYEGIDPVAARAALATNGNDAQRIADLEAALAAQQLDHAIGSAFLAMGGRADAREFIVGRAKADGFTVTDGRATTAAASVTNPGQPMTIDEWLQGQFTTAAFAFKPSTGGGADNSGSRHAARRVIASDPLTVGKHLEDLAAGRVTVG
jgi:hypothetical protein